MSNSGARRSTRHPSGVQLFRRRARSEHGGRRADWRRRPSRTLTSVSEDSGRKYVIPDDPDDRPVRSRRAVRVIVVGPDNRVLLFEDSDPGIAGVTWWVTPGGGMDPGETERTTAVREMAEETGYVLTEDELVGPLATRYAVHGYSDQVLEQQETFYLVRVAAFEIDIERGVPLLSRPCSPFVTY